MKEGRWRESTHLTLERDTAKVRLTFHFHRDANDATVDLATKRFP
jgi:hypothetical protein